MRDDELDDLLWDEWSWEAIRSQQSQIEFDWFAIDGAGQLAALASFGVGPSPAAVRAFRERFNSLLAVVARLEEYTSAIVEPLSTGDTESWQSYARCGLFGYDNGNIRPPYNRRYNRIVQPLTPLRIDTLPILVELFECLPRLPVLFADSPSIDFDLIPK